MGWVLGVILLLLVIILLGVIILLAKVFDMNGDLEICRRELTHDRHEAQKMIKKLTRKATGRDTADV